MTAPFRARIQAAASAAHEKCVETRDEDGAVVGTQEGEFLIIVACGKCGDALRKALQMELDDDK